MAVTYWKEIHDGRDGDVESTKTRSVRRYTRVFRAGTNNATDDAMVVRAYGLCPKIGTLYPYDIGSWCRRITARNESFSRTYWLVTALYSSEFEISENPLADPAEINWDASPFQRPYFKDIDGEAILNSAGDYPDPPIEGDDSRWIVNVQKNLGEMQTAILSYRNTVNSVAFLLDGVPIAVRCALLSSIKISSWQERNDIKFRVLSMAFHVSGDNWDKVWLDQGMNELLTWDGMDALVRAKFPDGTLATSPVLLDGAGARLELPTPATAVYNTHKIYKEKDFRVLPIT